MLVHEVRETSIKTQGSERMPIPANKGIVKKVPQGMRKLLDLGETGRDAPPGRLYSQSVPNA